MYVIVYIYIYILVTGKGMYFLFREKLTKFLV